MTREEKILKKKLRAKRRKEKHFAKYVEKIQVAKSIGDYGIPLHCVKQGRCPPTPLLPSLPRNSLSLGVPRTPT